MTTHFVIKEWDNGVAKYLYDLSPNVEFEQDRSFDNIYGIDAAKKFDSHKQAMDFLIERFKKNHWGGKFQIEEVIINR